jgi:hypothetical protein
MNSVSVIMRGLGIGAGADDGPRSACYDSGSMLREISATARTHTTGPAGSPRAAIAAFLFASIALGGCGIKGALKLPPAPATAAPPAVAPAAPAPPASAPATLPETVAAPPAKAAPQ